MTLASLLSKALHGAVLIGLLASPAVVVAQGTAARPAETDCAGFEPDPVQISWNAPCDEGSWLFSSSASAAGCGTGIPRHPTW